MTNTSNITITGNCVHSPKLHRGDKNPFCTVAIAVNTGWGDHKKATYWDCKFFGKKAETVSNHFSKGDPILVIGEAYMDYYETKDGERRQQACINARDFGFIGGKRPDESPRAREERFYAQTADQQPGGRLFRDEDVPF